mmetsp:Transcript_57327/g.113824  ORF Transcript_57327/g.113824 Transcript_57327/m.113824 type:complete len:318 (+) Transcript_57327:213-1166(+)
MARPCSPAPQTPLSSSGRCTIPRQLAPQGTWSRRGQSMCSLAIAAASSALPSAHRSTLSSPAPSASLTAAAEASAAAVAAAAVDETASTRAGGVALSGAPPPAASFAGSTSTAPPQQSPSRTVVAVSSSRRVMPRPPSQTMAPLPTCCSSFRSTVGRSLLCPSPTRQPPSSARATGPSSCRARAAPWWCGRCTPSSLCIATRQWQTECRLPARACARSPSAARTTTPSSALKMAHFRSSPIRSSTSRCCRRLQESCSTCEPALLSPPPWPLVRSHGTLTARMAFGRTKKDVLREPSPCYSCKGWDIVLTLSVDIVLW